MDITSLFSHVDIEVILKIIISITLGFLIGVERELTNKSAGLRTHMLVCLGSTVFTILSIYSFSSIVLHNGVRIQNDPARIAAQILTGIGFIGGGAVLHHGISVSGLTTAATLWITASIGMAVGAGSYTVAITSTIMSLLVLILMRKLERVVLSRHRIKSARIKATLLCTPENVSDIQEWFNKNFSNIVEMNQKKSAKDEDLVKIAYTMDIYETNPINLAYKKIKELKNIESLTLQQLADES